MGAAFRVIDTGLRGGRENLAFDRALIEARAADEVGDTIRFLHFTPCALLGRHQVCGHEIDLAACAARGIEIGRRITGGGAIYLDPGQLGWELVFSRGSLGVTTLSEAAERICVAAAAGLSGLGIPAHFRPRNDIEVEGRKLGGTGGFFDGEVLFYQGTVLVDFDAEAMLAALRLPAAKLARHGVAAMLERMVSLRALLGAAPPMALVQDALLEGFARELGIMSVPAQVSAGEEARAQAAFRDELGTDAFVFEPSVPDNLARWGSAEARYPGGGVRVDLCRDHRGRLRDVLITGDFFVTPPRLIRDLEARLRGAAAEDAGVIAASFLAACAAGLLSLAPEDVARVVGAAAEAAP